MAQLRHARPGLHAGLRHQALQQRADRLGAQEHGLHQAAGVQQPVGEDVAAIGVGAELDLVDREELRVAVERHRLDRAGEPARIGRDDLLLAGDQRDVAGALLRHHAIVVLAGEQAEREADDAGGVRQHPLDGEMGLAGIRRTEDGFDARGETGIEAEHGHAGCLGVAPRNASGSGGGGDSSLTGAWVIGPMCRPCSASKGSGSTSSAPIGGSHLMSMSIAEAPRPRSGWSGSRWHATSVSPLKTLGI